MPQDLVAPDVAAARLGVSVKSLARWAADGRLAAYKIGPRVTRYSASEVEALVTRIPAGH